MWSWIKNLIPTPKKVIGLAVDALDTLVPILAVEMDKTKEKLNAMNSTEKAQWLVDKVQEFLRKRFGLDA